MPKVAEIERWETMKRANAGKTEGKHLGHKATYVLVKIKELRKTLPTAKTAEALGCGIPSVKDYKHFNNMPLTVAVHPLFICWLDIKRITRPLN